MVHNLDPDNFMLCNLQYYEVIPYLESGNNVNEYKYKYMR
jgi:hypothetical protein